MTRLLPTAMRWTAIAIAIAAVVDPLVHVPRRERAAVRISGTPDTVATRVASSLTCAGFSIDPQPGADVSVAVTDRIDVVSASEGPTWVIDTTPPPPNVRVTHASAGGARLPNQAVEITLTIDAAGESARTTDVVIEDAGVPVASTRHTWSRDTESWTTTLQYLPPSTSPGRLRVVARPLPGETSSDDNGADVAVPPLRGPLRVLVLETAVTWPALFVRRALEGEPAFRLAAVQRASKGIATRAGAPPAAVTRDTLRSFDVAIVGGPENLSSSDVAAFRWFVEQRGGVVLFVPDKRPQGPYTSLVGSASFDERLLSAPIRLGEDLAAAELALPVSPPPTVEPLAVDGEGRPVVFLTRRGAGAVIFSGALDAWRQRALDDDGFARFWRRVVARAGATVPSPLEVSLQPATARPGEAVTVTARLRTTELAASDRLEIAGVEARAISPATKRDDPIRLWPTAEPGVFSGTWRAGVPGSYNVSVSSGALHADATIVIDPAVMHARPSATDDLARLARASGGQAFATQQLDAMIAAMKNTYPTRTVMHSAHPMRSPWWCLPFAVLLCAEWALRRTRGLA